MHENPKEKLIPHHADGLVIRRADEADIPVLHSMVLALSAYHSDESSLTIEALARDVLGEHPWAIVFLAERDGVAVGYMALNPLVRLATGRRGMELQHLFVAEEARGTGIGSRLVEAGAEIARSMHCSYFVVGTHENNVPAQQFYLARRFERMELKNLRFMRSL